MTHLPNSNIHVQQSGWLQEQAPFPYAAITAAIHRQSQVVVAPLLPLADEAPQVLLPPLLVPTILEFGDSVQEASSFGLLGSLGLSSLLR